MTIFDEHGEPVSHHKHSNRDGGDTLSLKCEICNMQSKFSAQKMDKTRHWDVRLELAAKLKL